MNSIVPAIDDRDALQIETAEPSHSHQSGVFSSLVPGIRGKLTLLLVFFGLAPAVILMGILYSQEKGIKTALAAKMAENAVAINDVIDRNLFERYGDVQAFGLNTAAHNPANWNFPGEDNPLVKAMNGYMTGYGIYKLMLLLDSKGKVIGVNSVDAGGKPLATDNLYGRSFAQASWFKNALDGNFLVGQNGITGTAVEQPHREKVVAELYGSDGYVIPFSAPVRNSVGEVLGVWVNFADFGLVEEIVATFYERLVADGMNNAELTVLDRQGRIIVDYDPVAKGFRKLSQYKRDLSVIGKFNLADAGVLAAQQAVKGENGAMQATHARKGIVQAAGYAHSEGAYGYPGLGWSALVRTPVNEAFGLWNQLLLVMLTALVISGAVIGVAGIWFGSRTAQPIRAITDAMKTLSSGRDIDHVPATERNDEIGDMGRAVQVWRQNRHRNAEREAERKRAEEQTRADQQRREQDALDAERSEVEQQTQRAAKREQRSQRMEDIISSFEQQISAVVSTVSSSATQMKSSAQSMSDTADQTSQQATTVAAASEEATVNVQTVASSAEELSASIDEISRQVTQSNQIAQNAVNEARETNAQVEGLAEAAQRIGDVVNLINDIASQTNLLALNATIEAARAGDAGKGFAVVASEVKSLANQTGKATEEIGAQISAMQDATAGAVQAIQGIGSTIDQLGEIATSVASAVTQQGAATREIANSVQQAAAGTQEVSGSISQVTQAANDSKQSSAQMLGAAEELSRQGDVLRSEVDKFLSEIRAA